MDPLGLEYLALDDHATGASATGLIVVEFKRRVAKLRYTVDYDSNWRFLQASLTLERDGELERRLAIQRKENEDWLFKGQARMDPEGCSYIDIMVTPFTNTLPIRNLKSLIIEW